LAQTAADDEAAIAALTNGIHSSRWNEPQISDRIRFLETGNRILAYISGRDTFCDWTGPKANERFRQTYNLTRFLSAFHSPVTPDAGIKITPDLQVVLVQECDSQSLLLVVMSRALGANAETIRIEPEERRNPTAEEKANDVFRMPENRQLVGGGDRWTTADTTRFKAHQIVLRGPPGADERARFLTDLYFDPSARLANESRPPTSKTLLQYVPAVFLIGALEFHKVSPPDDRALLMLTTFRDRSGADRSTRQQLIVYDSIGVLVE
jgi:hypothetical protein